MDIDDLKKIKISDFDYALPENRIAKYPLQERDASKLLVFKDGKITDSVFSGIAGFLPENSLLITNNTRVIQARLVFYKPTGARIEIFCLEPVDPPDFAMNFQQKHSCVWKCLVGNLKKWKNETLINKVSNNNQVVTVKAEKTDDFSAYQYIRFSWDDHEMTCSDILSLTGETPIPPYLDRKSENIDRTRYQTIYSKTEGSVAAPTAGLHFTTNVMNALSGKNIRTEQITLHVGAGTFKPVQSDLVTDHEMHTEYFFVGLPALHSILNNSENLFAVGTTSLRTLESLYLTGIKILKGDKDFQVSQWDYISNNDEITFEESIRAVIGHMQKEQISMLKGSTRLMIVPGYQVKSVKGIITNFHQPRSTLLLLVSAIVKDKREKIYSHALSHGYRFLSYGDSSLLFIY